MFKRKSLSSSSQPITIPEKPTSPTTPSPNENDAYRRSQSVSSMSNANTDSSSQESNTTTTTTKRGTLTITSSSALLTELNNNLANAANISSTNSSNNISSNSSSSSNNTLKERKKSLSSLKSMLTPKKLSSSSSNISHQLNNEQHENDKNSSLLNMKPRESSNSSLGSALVKTPLHLLFPSKTSSSTSKISETGLSGTGDFSDTDDLSEVGTDISEDHDLKELKDSIQGFEKELSQLNTMSSSPKSISPTTMNSTESGSVPKASINTFTSTSTSGATATTPTRGRAVSEAQKKKKKDDEMDVLSFLQDWEEEKKKDDVPTSSRKQSVHAASNSLGGGAMAATSIGNAVNGGRNRFNTLTEKLKKVYYDHKKKEEEEESDGDSDDGESAFSSFGGKHVNILGQLAEEYKGMESVAVIAAEKERREQERVFSPLVILRQFEREKKLTPKYKVVNVYFEKVTFM
ncbi:predicted protein [Naegleria gruberi]|uniref:Predicted protein n=2 Tax=Naegleria gruberi TaxID=5762 RepID=D2VAQ9_NAEGR|nr:uncharacterized protein NAEGRDRAFT_48015 [Naegleria gruberi]EFC46121.1 predicted protein [Naegleria gruberi]|eukprot:XP_002678865.1 predicted protein [Naegleria gruberi strain NEG-M]